MPMRHVVLLAGALHLGCGGGGGRDASDTVEAEIDGAPEADAEPDADVPETPLDAPGDDADGTDGGPGVCERLGLPVRPWVEAPDDASLFAVAADATFETLDGVASLRELWSGCEVLMFVQDEPAQVDDWAGPLWSRDVRSLLARSPRNAHWFFVSTQVVGSARLEALAALQAEVEAALGGMSEEDRAWWSERVHYLPARARDLPGWLGRLLGSPGWGVAVDRFQRIRFLGSYGDYARYDAAHGWFRANLAMAANEVRYYNFEAEREARLAAEDAVVVRLFDGVEISDPGWTGVPGYAEVELPDAATMAGFDGLELDLTLACIGDGEYGDCPAWDYDVLLYLCDAAEPDRCDTWLGHWITTYHRWGRWVHDVSGLLPLLAGGGRRRFAFYTTQPYAVTLDLRFVRRGSGLRPVEAHPLWSGGDFDAGYDALHPPRIVAVPADAVRVELATVLSGHGGVEPENCSEFCDMNHHFLVNGHDNLRRFPEAGTESDCMTKVDQGTVPNQYGTWWYGRSGWCPGKEVPFHVFDVTDQVLLGADNTLEYTADYRGAPYPRSGAHIRLSSWLIVWR
ncbi:MAG: hypothetical protein GYA57_05860 [Myxococcales bacterium]|nr:hypothetical protein [Myxococcales bacterium]